MANAPISPANGNVKVTSRVRIPMSVPRQKGLVPEIPGYHCHWMSGKPGRIQQALEAGYQFVDEKELRSELQNFDIAGDTKVNGNTDLGTRVSRLEGGDSVGEDHQPVRMYLMKLPEDLFREDQKALEVQNDKIRQALKRGTLTTKGDQEDDTASRYVDRARTDLGLLHPRKI